MDLAPSTIISRAIVRLPVKLSRIANLKVSLRWKLDHAPSIAYRQLVYTSSTVCFDMAAGDENYWVEYIFCPVLFLHVLAIASGGFSHWAFNAPNEQLVSVSRTETIEWLHFVEALKAHKMGTINKTRQPEHRYILQVQK